MDVNCHQMDTFIKYSVYQKAFFHVSTEHHIVVVLRFNASLSINFFSAKIRHEKAGFGTNVRWTHGLSIILTNAQSSCPKPNPFQSSSDRLVNQSSPHAAPGSRRSWHFEF